MSTHVITPVGTSILTNHPDIRSSENGDYEKIHGKSLEYWSNSSYERRINNIRTKITEWAKGKISRNEIDASAEITSTVKLLEKLKSDLHVQLLATDTIESKLSAEIVKAVLDGHVDAHGHNINVFFKPDIDVVHGLQVTNQPEFEDVGMMNLFERIEGCLPEEGSDYYKTILNITGGFKGVIPYLTIVGQLYNLPQYYIFENTENLLRIPHLPIQFDWGLVEQYYPYLKKDLEPKHDKKIGDELKALHLMQQNNKGFYKTTVLGKMFAGFVEKESPLAKNVLGYFVEYKLFEYYLRNPYLDKKGKPYRIVERSVQRPEFGKAELDIVLQKSSDGQSPCIVIECKSFLKLSIQKLFPELQNQIQRQLYELKKAGKTPREYHLCLYIFPGMRKQLKNVHLGVKTLQGLFTVFPTCEFKVFLLSIDLSYSLLTGKRYKNLYQKFMSQPIEPSELEEYTL